MALRWSCFFAWRRIFTVSSQTTRSLLQTQGIKLINFTQTDGYMRRISYLNKLVIPKGAPAAPFQGKDHHKMEKGLR
jgi:hypothetical protein